MQTPTKKIVAGIGALLVLYILIAIAFRINRDRWPYPLGFLDRYQPISVVPLFDDLSASTGRFGFFHRGHGGKHSRNQDNSDSSSDNSDSGDSGDTTDTGSTDSGSTDSGTTTPPPVTVTPPPVVVVPPVTTTPPPSTTTTSSTRSGSTTTTTTPPKSTTTSTGSGTTTTTTSSTTTTTPPKTTTTPTSSSGSSTTSTSSSSTTTTTTSTTTLPPTSSGSSTSQSTQATTTPPATTTPVAPVLNYKVGMALGNTLFNLSDSDLSAELNDIASLGIGWIRIDMAWDDVQYNNSTTYDWSAFDRIVNTANTDHLRVLADLGYTPSWARSSTCTANNDTCPPASNTQFATFASAAVQRYASQGVLAWEVWNEPNIGRFWEPAANVGAYVDLLKSTYQAIKKQSPSATVISACLAPALTGGNNISPTDFLTAMYQNGAGGSFDALGDHPYSFPAPPSMYESWSGWSQLSDTPTSLLGIMYQHGDTNKKIWLTEYGAPTGGPGLSAWIGDTDLNSLVDHDTDNLQSQTITQAIVDDEQDGWAGPIFLYSYKDIGTSSSTVENFFGLLRADGSQKPAYGDVKALLATPQ